MMMIRDEACCGTRLMGSHVLPLGYRASSLFELILLRVLARNNYIDDLRCGHSGLDGSLRWRIELLALCQRDSRILLNPK